MLPKVTSRQDRQTDRQDRMYEHAALACGHNNESSDKRVSMM